MSGGFRWSRRFVVSALTFSLLVMNFSSAEAEERASCRKTVTRLGVLALVLGLLILNPSSQLQKTSGPSSLPPPPAPTPTPTPSPEASPTPEAPSQVEGPHGPNEEPAPSVPAAMTPAPVTPLTETTTSNLGPYGVQPPLLPSVTGWLDFLDSEEKPGSILILSSEDRARLEAERKSAEAKALALKLEAEKAEMRRLEEEAARLAQVEAARRAEEERIRLEAEKKRLEEQRLMEETQSALTNLSQSQDEAASLEIIQKNLQMHAATLITDDNIRKIFYASYRMPVGEFRRGYDDKYDQLTRRALQIFSEMNRMAPEAKVWTKVTQALADFRRYKWTYDYRAPWVLARAGQEAIGILKTEYEQPNKGGLNAYEVLEHIADYGAASEEDYLKAQILRAEKQDQGEHRAWLHTAHRSLLAFRVRWLAQSQTSAEAAEWARKIFDQLQSSKILQTADGTGSIRSQAFTTLGDLDRAHPDWNLLEMLKPELSAASSRGPTWLKERVTKLIKSNSNNSTKPAPLRLGAKG